MKYRGALQVKALVWGEALCFILDRYGGSAPEPMHGFALECMHGFPSRPMHGFGADPRVGFSAWPLSIEIELLCPLDKKGQVEVR